MRYKFGVFEVDTQMKNYYKLSIFFCNSSQCFLQIGRSGFIPQTSYVFNLCWQEKGNLLID